MHCETTSPNESFYQTLILESDSRQVRPVLEALARRGLRGTVATTARAAMTLLERGRWHLAMVSGDFPVGGDADRGQTLLCALRAEHPELPIIMLCDAQTVAAATDALRAGCADVLQKPLTAEAVDATLDRFLPNHKPAYAAVVTGQEGREYPIVGSSAALRRAIQTAEAIAPTSAPVLIAGPSGTGKELLAELIHRRSKRAAGPLVRVNCAALSESLLESELFGHEKGAFTGAVLCHKGRLERAHSGTLFLDEITETPPAFQAKLLRALEQMQFERVGGVESIRVNVRVVSTTNRDILSQVRAGTFRADLYYRLCGVCVRMPALRERLDDLPGLIWWFVNEFAHEAGRAITAIDPRTLTLFEAYAWPGNIRQLRNTVRTMMVLGRGSVLSAMQTPEVLEQLTQDVGVVAGNDTLDLLDRPLEEIERQAILTALRQANGNRTRAAQRLGISDRTLREKVKKYNPAAAMSAATAE